jgi:hypothetical protein
MAKEGYKPTAGMKAAAKRALRWKEQGKAKGAGTMVGWTTSQRRNFKFINRKKNVFIFFTP